MRIFAPQLGLNPDSSSGGEVYDVKILTGLAERGHKIDVLLRKGQKAPEIKNISIHYLPFNINTAVYKICLLQLVFHIPSVKKLIKKADIFRVHSPYNMGFSALVFRKMVKKCPPLWFHYHHREGILEMNFFDKFLPAHADGITVDNYATLVDLEKKCPSIKRVPNIATINIGTDTDLFRPIKPDMKIRDSLGIKKDDKIVLFVGHLIHRKGIDVLLDSWKSVRKEFKDVHLILIGRGAMGKSLEHLVKQHQQIDRNIHHIPHVSTQKDLLKYYNVSDVFAFPTRLEGHGMTAAEAMACGMPVVTTNAAGVRRFVLDGKTGYKVNIGDVKQFTEKLKILLSDDSLRKRMGRAARRHIEENWTWDVSIDQTEKFMEKVVNRK